MNGLAERIVSRPLQRGAEDAQRRLKLVGLLPMAKQMLTNAARKHLTPVRGLAAVAMTATLLLGVAAPSHAAAKKYKNCSALNEVYPHGVGRKGAKDKASGTPVTNFKVSQDLYAANKGSDRDRDGIACEKS